MKNFFHSTNLVSGFRTLVYEIKRHLPSYELIWCESTPLWVRDISVTEEHTDWLISFEHDCTDYYFHPGEDCESIGFRGQTFGLGRVVGVRTRRQRQTVAIAGVGKAYEPETSWRHYETTSTETA